MPNPTMLIHDVTTGEVTEVELTDEQVAEREAEAAAFEQEQAAAEAAREAALEKLAAIGLNVDDLKALGLAL